MGAALTHPVLGTTEASADHGFRGTASLAGGVLGEPAGFLSSGVRGRSAPQDPQRRLTRSEMRGRSTEKQIGAVLLVSLSPCHPFRLWRAARSPDSASSMSGSSLSAASSERTASLGRES